MYKIKKLKLSDVMLHTDSPSIQEAEARGCL